jgi:hypothetical protein
MKHNWLLVGFLSYSQVKAVVLDPGNGFNMDRTLMKSDVQKLVKVIIW